MRTATTIEASHNRGGGFRETLDFVLEAERVGLDICWVAEAWGSDGPSALGYLAGRTSRLHLGSGIMQLDVRTPVSVAQTALTLSEMSEGRFILGLGTSGPQVIEGLHGEPFAAPLTRMRETLDIIRQCFAGDKVSYSGTRYRIPRPEGDAHPMRLSIGPNPGIPIFLAAMSPNMLELTGERADGWLGTSFVPEGADAYFRHLDRGLAKSGRNRSSLQICQGAEVAFAEDEDQLPAMVAGRKKELAFSLGGMGSATVNYYNSAYSRQGWSEVARAVWEHWQAGDHSGAAALIPDEMVLSTTLIGTEQRVRERLRTWHEAGVDIVRLYPAGDTLAGKVSTLARAIEIASEIE